MARNVLAQGLATRGRHPHTPRPVFRVRNERLFFGALGFVGVIVLWESVVRLGLIRRSLMSSPTLVVETAINDFGNGILQPHIQTSLLEFSTGFAAALITGIPLGLAIGWFRRLNYVVDPWLSAIYATPTIALVPLIILVFGIGLESKIVVVWLEAIFMIVVSTLTGVQSVDHRHREIARSFKAPQWLTFRSVVLPSSVPFILTGIRLGAGRALVGVVVAELIASNVGIGFYISYAGVTLNTSRVMLGVILLGIFGITMGEIVRRIELRFDAWRPEIHGRH